MRWFRWRSSPAPTARGLEVAALVNHLFATYRKADGRAYTNDDVCADQPRLLGSLDPAYLASVRAGLIDAPDHSLLHALCNFFGEPLSYFFPELAEREAARREADGGSFAIHARGHGYITDPTEQQKMLAFVKAALQEGPPSPGRDKLLAEVDGILAHLGPRPPIGDP